MAQVQTILTMKGGSDCGDPTFPARRRNAASERQFASAWKSSIWTQQKFDRPKKFAPWLIDAQDVYAAVEVPAAFSEASHPADPLSHDISGEERAEPVPPHPNSLVADIDAAFSKQILYIP